MNCILIFVLIVLQVISIHLLLYICHLTKILLVKLIHHHLTLQRFLVQILVSEHVLITLLLLLVHHDLGSILLIPVSLSFFCLLLLLQSM